MGSPLGPLLANVFFCATEDKLFREGSLPKFYKRYVDDTIVIMDSKTAPETFLAKLNICHASLHFTMELENNNELPFLGMKVMKIGKTLSTRVHKKPSDTA